MSIFDVKIQKKMYVYVCVCCVCVYVLSVCLSVCVYTT